MPRFFKFTQKLRTVAKCVEETHDKEFQKLQTLMMTYGTRSPTVGAVAGSRFSIFLASST